jgi:hypothetical protein
MTVAVAKKIAAVPPVGRVRLPAGILKLEQHGRQSYFFKASPGIVQEDLRYAETWANLSKLLRRHDLVNVLADDESWELELCVERPHDGGVDMTVRKLYQRTGITAATVPVADGFHCEWRPGEWWCVVRQRDGVAVEKGHPRSAHGAPSSRVRWCHERG